jgi:hypothetical protein
MEILRIFFRSPLLEVLCDAKSHLLSSRLALER